MGLFQVVVVNKFQKAVGPALKKVAFAARLSFGGEST
jgi:hypothetical protein